MDNLSFHITDITANSIRAKASDIEIDIQIKDTSICIRIADNGCGMAVSYTHLTLPTILIV